MAVVRHDDAHQALGTAHAALYVKLFVEFDAGVRVLRVDQAVAGNGGADVAVGVIVFITQNIVAAGNGKHGVGAQEGYNGIVEVGNIFILVRQNPQLFVRLHRARRQSGLAQLGERPV